MRQEREEDLEMRTNGCMVFGPFPTSLVAITWLQDITTTLHHTFKALPCLHLFHPHTSPPPHTMPTLLSRAGSFALLTWRAGQAIGPLPLLTYLSSQHPNTAGAGHVCSPGIQNLSASRGPSPGYHHPTHRPCHRQRLRLPALQPADSPAQACVQPLPHGHKPLSRTAAPDW